MSTLLLRPGQCERLLDHPSLVEALGRAHTELATGGATQPLPVPMRAAGDTRPDGPAYVPMAAYAPYLGVCAVKLLADVPSNRGLGLPAQRSTLALYSAESAECLALVDGRVITRLRTAAVSALATRLLARPGTSVLGLIGAGALATEHVHAFTAVLGVTDVLVWSRSEASARRLDGEVDADVRIAPSVEAVLAGADVVCTLTPAEVPLVTAGMLHPGLHVNAVGSPPRPGYSELEPGALAGAARVVVDHRPVALRESGNVREAVRRGVVAESDLVELGDVLAGTVVGRGRPEDVTVFNSVGIGLQDLAALELLHRRAVAEGVGDVVDLRA